VWKGHCHAGARRDRIFWDY